MTGTERKIALFIDGPNLHATARNLGFDIDYKRFLLEFQSRGSLVRAFYYNTIIENADYPSIRPLTDWLAYNGYAVITKTKDYTDSLGPTAKGKVDIQLAIDALELAKFVQEVVLVSGNGDFCPLVEALQRRGVYVSVISTISTRPPMLSDDLRRQADLFIDLAELRSKVGRDIVRRIDPA